MDDPLYDVVVGAVAITAAAITAAVVTTAVVSAVVTTATTMVIHDRLRLSSIVSQRLEPRGCVGDVDGEQRHHDAQVERSSILKASCVRSRAIDRFGRGGGFDLVHNDPVGAVHRLHDAELTVDISGGVTLVSQAAVILHDTNEIFNGDAHVQNGG